MDILTLSVLSIILTVTLRQGRHPVLPASESSQNGFRQFSRELAIRNAGCGVVQGYIREIPRGDFQSSRNRRTSSSTCVEDTSVALCSWRELLFKNWVGGINKGYYNLNPNTRVRIS